MVVFTCQHCGDPVKKPKVEKHYYTKCRFKTPNLTCVDCLKDFVDLEYDAHNQCLSEEQRYAAKGTVVKEYAGRNKQMKYVEIVQSLLNSKDLSDNQRKLLNLCSKFDNIPRRLNKFYNFLKNTPKHIKYSKEDVDSVFKLLNDCWTNITTPQKSSSESKDTLKKDVQNVEHREPEEENTSINDDFEPKKKKKKEQDGSNGSIVDEAIVENNNVIEKASENLNGISRKKLKKHKKYEKYMKELENEAETEVNGNIEHNESVDDSNRKLKKKSKRLKKDCSNSDQQHHNDNVNGESVQSMEVVPEKKSHKKSKKRKMDDAICDIIEKKKKEIPAEVKEVATFDWTDVIVRVLESRPEKELSLKRLSKKVINEYQSVKQDHKTYEELSAKFNKKVKKTQGVRILKDRAKLIQ